MGRYGSVWFPMDSLWFPMGRYGAAMGRVTWKGCSISSLSGSWLLLGSYGAEGVPMGLNVSLWGPYGSLWV